MAEKSSAKILEGVLSDFRGELTVADAATRSGLPLREAEEGLRSLAADYAGHLAATSKGELIYSFPGGLVRPAETRLVRRAGRALVKLAAGTARLLVRAWVSVVLVGYALVFLAVLIALALRSSDDRDGPSPMDGIGTVLRMVAEAVFWTFHPWSPVMIGVEPGWLNTGPRRRRLPFYERVNRFVFGPPRVKPDPREQERQVLAEIRRQKGRIAPADVMRITGSPREEAERRLLRLVVDYDGELSVSDSGAILYRFAELRTSAGTEGRDLLPMPVWNRREELAPLTGNTAGSNLLFSLINGFNLAVSGFVLANGLTLERLTAIFAQLRTPEPLPVPAPDGLPLALGLVPFAFSLALFALPALRALRRPAESRRVARENGWRELLRVVLGRAPAEWRAVYTDDELRKAWLQASGRAASDVELGDAVRALGGETDVDADGVVVHRFDTVSRELEALLGARARAADDEAAAGKVIFSSADPGAGIRDDAETSTTGKATASAKPTAPGGAAPDGPVPAPAVPRLEEAHQSMEFLDRLMAESAKRRRD